MDVICWAIITAISAIITTYCDGLPARGKCVIICVDNIQSFQLENSETN
jgi:hypothetical protein